MAFDIQKTSSIDHINIRRHDSMVYNRQNLPQSIFI